MPGVSVIRRELTAGDSVAAGLLDALPDPTAVIDGDGVIVGVNHAWQMFGVDNGADPKRTGVGVNYLEVCRRSADEGCLDAGAVVSALQAVLAGEAVEADYEYPCPSPSVGRWFAVRMTQMARPELGVVMSHTNITRRKLAEADLELRASRDPLTGLANRARLTEALQTALSDRPGRGSEPDVGLLYLDLDRFKPVNDTYGHAAGDEVLQAVAHRLELLTRPQDTVARLGGDEFAVLVPRIGRSQLDDLAARVIGALAQPHLVHGHPVVVPASVGSYHACGGEDAGSCLERADASMYSAKRAFPPPN